MQGDVHPFGNVIGDQRRNADAEIDVVAFAQFLRGAFREQIAHGRSGFRDRRALHGAELDPLLVFLALDDPVDINARRVDLIGIEFADFDQFLDLRDADLAAGRDHRVEIPRRFSVDEVAGFIALPCLHQRNLGRDARLEHIFLVAEIFRLFAFGQFRAEAGARVKSRDARAARAQSFRQRALRNQLELEFAREHLPLELLVLAHIGSHHFFHLPRREQNAHPETIHARVVAHDGQSFHAAVVQRRDQILRDAAQPEAAGSDRHVVVQQAIERGLGVRINFAHVEEI